MAGTSSRRHGGIQNCGSLHFGVDSQFQGWHSFPCPVSGPKLLQVGRIIRNYYPFKETNYEAGNASRGLVRDRRHSHRW